MNGLTQILESRFGECGGLLAEAITNRGISSEDPDAALNFLGSKARVDFAECKDTSPPGMEKIVEALKRDGGIKDPWAVAWAMHSSKKESNSMTSQGQLLRKGIESRREFVQFQPLRETSNQPQMSGGVARVVIITEGAGNKKDRNFYPAEALQRSARVFEGKKCFLNHPSVSEEHDRPERDVREVCGWFRETGIEEVDGKVSIVGNLHFTRNAAGREGREIIQSAMEYQQQVAGLTEDVLVGLSINAEGPSHVEMMEGLEWHVVEEIAGALSADLVTFPARGGKIVALREANRSLGWRRRFVEAMREAYNEEDHPRAEDGKWTSGGGGGASPKGGGFPRKDGPKDEDEFARRLNMPHTTKRYMHTKFETTTILQQGSKEVGSKTTFKARGKHPEKTLYVLPTMATDDKPTLVDELKARDAKKEQGNWVPASGGTETPFKTASGRTLQYLHQPSTGKHAYIDTGSDIILSDKEAEEAMRHAAPSDPLSPAMRARLDRKEKK